MSEDPGEADAGALVRGLYGYDEDCDGLWKEENGSVVLTELPSQPGLWFLITGLLLGHWFLGTTVSGAPWTLRGKAGPVQQLTAGRLPFSWGGGSQKTSEGQSSPGVSCSKQLGSTSELPEQCSPERLTP